MPEYDEQREKFNQSPLRQAKRFIPVTVRSIINQQVTVLGNQESVEDGSNEQ
jgi:hypothetical protein